MYRIKTQNDVVKPKMWPITNRSSKIVSFSILLLLRETSLFVVVEGDIGKEAQNKSGSEPCEGLV